MALCLRSVVCGSMASVCVNRVCLVGSKYRTGGKDKHGEQIPEVCIDREREMFRDGALETASIRRRSARLGVWFVTNVTN